MTISKRRLELRKQALETAASMIHDYTSGGMEPNEIGLEDEEELVLFDKECKSAAKRIYKIAEKIKA